MPFPLSCPLCRCGLQARDEHAGKTLKCPGCQAAIAVPSVAAPQAAVSLAGQPGGIARAASRGMGKWIGLAAGAILVFGFGVFLGITATSESPGTPTRAGERVTLDCGKGVKMELARITAGTFIMGSPVTESGRSDGELQHQVTISKPFYLAIHPVTQAQYEAVTGKNSIDFNEDHDSPGKPVGFVSWKDAILFCRELSIKTGKTVRLPTEAEWEYACRAGTTSPFSFGVSIGREQANFGGNHGGTSQVGTFPANAWGLYDMHGNVREWCMDWYGEYPESNVTDPQGPRDGLFRVRRGGSWYDDAETCRSARRFTYNHFERPDGIGFRVALD